MARIRAEIVRESAMRRRKRAKELGFCGVCCKQKPRPGLSICAICAEARNDRQRRKRARDKETAKLRSVIEAHERAGDAAREHHLYDDAAQHYQDALKIGVVAPNDHSRISEKLAYALSLGARPEGAGPVFERLFSLYCEKASDPKKIVDILLQRCRHLWRNARTSEAIPLIEQVLEMQDKLKEPLARILAHTEMAEMLNILERYDEAETHVKIIAALLFENNVAGTPNFYKQQGVLAAQHGHKEEAFAHFERALQASNADFDIVSRVYVLGTYSYYAFFLGDIALAMELCEKAIALTREHHLATHIPGVVLPKANLLIVMGQYQKAYRCLVEALAYEHLEPQLETVVVSIGITLALHDGDANAFDLSADPSIEFAFRSGQPTRIASVVAAVVEWYAALERWQDIRKLLARTMRALKPFDGLWRLPISIAKYGSEEEVALMGDLFVHQLKRSDTDVKRACLAYFNAGVSLRRKATTESQRYVQEAVTRFTSLGWYGIADAAQGLLSEKQPGTTDMRESPEFSAQFDRLTIRERQVAELVFKGYTNRAIAEMLRISERTVEAHMTAIMQALGVRSRYQLEHRV